MKKKNKIIIGLASLIVIAVAFYIYAMFVGAKTIEKKEYALISNDVEEENEGLKILHFTDLHYGISIKKDDLIDIVNRMNEENADIIFFTGDLVDGEITDKQYNELKEVLVNLKANMGIYIINGNHDHFFKKWEQLIDEIGFININDSYDFIYSNSSSPIFVAGISDSYYSTKNIKDRSSKIFEYLNSESADTLKYKILLIHEPDETLKIDYNKFNLVLAGHSHNGQVRFPLIGAIYTPKGSKKYYKEHYKLNNTDLYISNGLGTTLLPIRLFNRPSYNVYRLTSK